MLWREKRSLSSVLNVLRWPVYLLSWCYVFLVILSPLPALGQGTSAALDADGTLDNGCRWDNLSYALDCSSLGLDRVPTVNSSISYIAKHLNLVNNSIETVTMEDVKSFMEVTVLDLRSNNIRVVEDSVFTGNNMPKLSQLFLADNQLRRLPDSVFKDTVFTTLDLSHNSFEYPPSALGHAAQIETLLLNNNPFLGLRKNSLANISGLSLLELSKCNLTNETIDPAVFSEFRGLRALYLDENYFPHITRRLFANISSLSQLSLQKCGIQTFEKKAFLHLRSLALLALMQNNITELFPNTFHDINLQTLDLSRCGIQNIRKGSLRSRITDTLFLDYNNISVIHNFDFRGLQGVKHVYLSNSGISDIRGAPFENLTMLAELHLDFNHLEDEDVAHGALNTSGTLSYLDLTGNKLTRIPSINGGRFPHLQELDIGYNRISHIGREHLRNMSSLSALILKGNPIQSMDEDVFAECPKVSDLNLDGTRIKSLPKMKYMPRLSDLHIVSGELESFPEDLCTTNSRLIIIEATNNNIQNLTDFSGCARLLSLALDHNAIKEIPAGVFAGLNKLDILKLHSNEISYIAPGVFDDLKVLITLTLFHNDIADLPTGLFQYMTALRKLNIGFNRIPKLEAGVFANNTLLRWLWVNNNDISEVSPLAFGKMLYLELLNMSSNSFCSLEFSQRVFPSLRTLALEQLWCLHEVPNPYEMPRAQELYYTYAYHCCLWEETLDRKVYQNVSEQPTTPPPHLTEPVTLPPDVVPILPGSPFDECKGESDVDRMDTIIDIAESFNLTIVWGPNCQFRLEGQGLGQNLDDLTKLNSGLTPTVVNQDILGTDNEDFFQGLNELRAHHVSEPTYQLNWKQVECFPRPNPLAPCDNLLDPWPIRIAIWAVWVLTLLGNVAVLFIMIAAREKMDVSQLFICVLAFANTLLGVYLAFIAMVDIRTLGERSFYQSALEWQKGSGCQTAGFLAIFSSQLSVYSLVALTLERLHAVATTSYVKEATRLRVAVVVVIIGLLYAGILALLPLSGVGVNAYDQVAICLPFVTETATDRNYILAILSLNMLGILIGAVGFVLVFVSLCRPSLTRAKRREIFKSVWKLSLLIIITFICWFPMAVVGYSAFTDNPLINAEQSKYFIVFVFPISALMSPMIYALITRSFRKNIWWIVTCCPARNKKGLPQHSIRLVQRQTTSTPTSLMSDLPRGQSPKSLTGEELRILRQSRRSNSYSVQFEPNLSQGPTLSVPGSTSRMGRRASLPAVFGSNISERLAVNGGPVFTPPAAIPFRLAPGLRSALNSSLPNLPEENEEAEAISETAFNGDGSSADASVGRKLSTVPEADEGEWEGDNATKSSMEHRLNVCEQLRMQNDFRDDASIASDESADYDDARDYRDGSPTRIYPRTGTASDISTHAVLSCVTSPVPSVVVRVKSSAKDTRPKLVLPGTCESTGISSQESNTLISTDICTCSSAVDSACCSNCHTQPYIHHPLSPSYSYSPSPTFITPKPHHRLESMEDSHRLSGADDATDFRGSPHPLLGPSYGGRMQSPADSANSSNQNPRFTYTKLREQMSPLCSANSTRFHIVNPTFHLQRSTQGSETDV